MSEYEEDIVVWSERQADLLRRRAAGELINDAELDWRADAIDFRQQAQRRFAPSMRQRIDVPHLYRQASRAIPDTVDGLPPLPILTKIPTLDELLSDD